MNDSSPSSLCCIHAIYLVTFWASGTAGRIITIVRPSWWVIVSVARFFEDINAPTFGFGIKTVDGITIFANSTRYIGTQLRPIEGPGIVILKLSVSLKLKAGDYFITIGIGEKNVTDDTQIDARHDIIHLATMQREYFEGFVNLNVTFQEVSRKIIAPPSAN